MNQLAGTVFKMAGQSTCVSQLR